LNRDFSELCAGSQSRIAAPFHERLLAVDPLRLWKVLTQDQAASTFRRLFASRHVADLQLIFWASCFLMIAGALFAFFWDRWSDDSDVIGGSVLISAIVGTGCGVLAWCYLTGSTRLGVVDLFACEITTICKVVAISEAAPHLVDLFSNPPPARMRFSSEEEYSPVFNNNSKDLQVLEARVVEPVTEFYTYLKTMRDYLRRLGDIEKPSEEVQRWRSTITNVIYMTFLMLESARKSVVNLVEFAPEQVEGQITILLSELVAFKFLIDHYERTCRDQYDARLERLRLRKRDYPEIVANVYHNTKYYKDRPGRDQKAWERAAALLAELNRRYFDAFGEDLDQCGGDRMLRDAA
jgi:hypothetical protein